MNASARLEFEPADFEAVVNHFSLKATGTPHKMS